MYVSIFGCSSSLLLRGLSPVTTGFSRDLGLLFIAALGLLILAAYLVAGHQLSAAASVVMALRLSCAIACRIFPDRGSSLCPLHWQADSPPLHHQRSPQTFLVWRKISYKCLRSKSKIKFAFCLKWNIRIRESHNPTVLTWAYARHHCSSPGPM